MARCFNEWTVLPHKPIEKLADNLWRVEGLMNKGKVQRQMVLARMNDGRVIVHNAIALEEPAMAELEAWGTPAVLFVPNAFHRQDAAIWKQRYPGIQVVAPAGGRKGVSRVVPVDATIEEAAGDHSARLVPLQGAPGEGVLEVRSGGETTLVFTDSIINVGKVGGFVGFLLAPTGRVAAPRIARLFIIKKKRAFVDQLRQLAASPGLKRVLFGHGKPIEHDPAGALERVISQLS